MSDKARITLTVNDREVEAWVTTNQALSEVLRTDAGQTDVKYGCGEGVCGTCTVLLDGDPVNSCLIFAIQADGASITTLQGLAEPDGSLSPLQQSFLRHGGSQCGFCTPGMVLTAHWHVQHNPDTDREGIRRALAGNSCRCTGYSKIVDAVEAYAEEAGGGG
jgi:aerobic carbon-monoxide dehydrogenase small subunit